MGFNIENDILLRYTQEKGVKEVVVPDGIKSIGEGAFRCCASLRKIILPEGIEKISAKAFDRCASLKSIDIPGSVKVIGSAAFMSCESLTTLKIPAGVEKIGYGLCACCMNMKSIEVAEGNSFYSSVGGVLLTKNQKVLISYPDAKEEYTIPESVERIQRFAFVGCDNLKKVTIPKSVNTIEEKAFMQCRNLETIVIDDGIEQIAKDAFYKCWDIARIRINGNESFITIKTGTVVKNTGETKADVLRIFDFICADSEKKGTIFLKMKNAEYKMLLGVFIIIEYQNGRVESYMKRCIKRTVKHLIDTDDFDTVNHIINAGWITNQNIDELVEYTIYSQKDAFYLILSDYRDKVIRCDKLLF